MSSLGATHQSWAKDRVAAEDIPSDHLLLEQQLRNLLNVLLVLRQQLCCPLVGMTTRKYQPNAHSEEFVLRTQSSSALAHRASPPSSR